MMQVKSLAYKQAFCNPSMHEVSTSLLPSTILAVGSALLKLMMLYEERTTPDDIKSKTGTQDQQIPTVSVRLYSSFITILPTSIERHTRNRNYMT